MRVGQLFFPQVGCCHHVGCRKGLGEGGREGGGRTISESLAAVSRCAFLGVRNWTRVCKNEGGGGFQIFERQ